MMLVPLLFALAAKSPDLGPMLPPGTAPNLQAAIFDIEKKLEASDFAAATKAAALLPKQSIVIQWDDSKVPPSLRKEFVIQRDKAIDDWSGITKASIKVGTSRPDLKFSFVDVLPPTPPSEIPAGAVYFWSDAANDVRLETVIGLKREKPAEPMNPVNVRNEVATAIGSYFGLNIQPPSLSFMGRTDQNLQMESRPSSQEMLLAREILSISANLRTAIHKQQRITPASPKVFFDPQSIDMGTIVQGDFAKFSLQVTNTGNAPLAMRFEPDCQCVSTDDHYQVVQPGSTYLLKGAYNTLLSVGQVRHALYLVTNDADQPMISVPVQIDVKPRFRFIFPEGNVIKLPEEGTTAVVYLILSDNSGINPQEAILQGLKGDVKVETWTGTLADPELKEGPKERHGYKISINLTGALDVPGRDPATLYVTTSNPQFPRIQTTLYAQRGIVVLPTELYMGEVGAGAKKYSIQVSGPANSFRVKKVSSSWPHLTFQLFPSDDGTQVIIQANYDGKGDPGPVFGSVDIQTDDAKQPLISLPIHATIKQR